MHADGGALRVHHHLQGLDHAVEAYGFSRHADAAELEVIVEALGETPDLLAVTVDLGHELRRKGEVGLRIAYRCFFPVAHRDDLAVEKNFLAHSVGALAER